MKNNGSNGNGQNGLPTVKKVALDAAAETQVNQVVKNLMDHLDLKKLTCPVETQDEIHHFLINAGYQKTAVRRTDWKAQKEADFFMEFSFDNSIIEHKKITRTGLIYSEPVA
ncbi:MAG: hypothetical protein WCT50_01560 [Patescibacteria group bacterium]